MTDLVPTAEPGVWNIYQHENLVGQLVVTGDQSWRAAGPSGSGMYATPAMDTAQSALDNFLEHR